MEESELPEFLCKSEQDLKKEEEEREQKELNPQGSRSRKEVHYGEGLTEDQWCEAVDASEDVNNLEDQHRRRQKRKRPEEEVEEDGASKKQKKRDKNEKLPPLPVELVSKMKALIDYIVEYEDNEG